MLVPNTKTSENLLIASKTDVVGTNEITLTFDEPKEYINFVNSSNYGMTLTVDAVQYSVDPISNVTVDGISVASATLIGDSESQMFSIQAISGLPLALDVENNSQQIGVITSPSASDVGKVWFATAEGEASFQSAAGTGDMNASVYDPTNVASDAFARANHTGTQSADTIVDGTTNKAYPVADKDKVDYISVTQAVDLDQIESDTASNKSKLDNITVTQAVDLDQIESDTADNTTDIDKSRDTETITGVADVYTVNCENLRRKKFDITTTTTSGITINLSNVTQANTLEAAVLLIATAVPATITHPAGYSYATSAPTVDTAGQEIWFLYDKNKGDTGGSIHWAWKVETP